jgi:hypothetical protein
MSFRFTKFKAGLITGFCKNRFKKRIEKSAHQPGNSKKVGL